MRSPRRRCPRTSASTRAPRGRVAVATRGEEMEHEGEAPGSAIAGKGHDTPSQSCRGTSSAPAPVSSRRSWRSSNVSSLGRGPLAGGLRAGRRRSAEFRGGFRRPRHQAVARSFCFLAQRLRNRRASQVEGARRDVCVGSRVACRRRVRRTARRKRGSCGVGSPPLLMGPGRGFSSLGGRRLECRGPRARRGQA